MTVTHVFPNAVVAQPARRRAFLLAALLVALVGLLSSAGASAAPPKDSDCLACHEGKVAKPLAASVHGEAGASCVDCHADLAKGPLPHKSKVAKVTCVGCHEGMAAMHLFHPMMLQDPVAVPCQDCHGGHDVLKAKDPKAKTARTNVASLCGTCHQDAVDTYTTSVHAKAAAGGVKQAPGCIDCHHTAVVTNVEGKPAAKKQAQEKMCLHCHLDNPEVRAKVAPSAGFIAAYEKSVHGAALLQGNEKAANCVDCHGGHEILPAANADSKVSRRQVRVACSKCHGAVAARFAISAHATALDRGVKEAPTCTTCHGEHGILKHTDPNSPVAAANVSQRVCTPCHSSLRLSEKYGISNDRFETFEASFHGLAVKGGSVAVANCASCHGAHEILPSKDPRSKISKENLTKTCGTCHPGANVRFATGKIHVSEAKESSPILYWLAVIYMGLIVGTIGGMGAHNLLDFVKKARHAQAVKRGEIEVEHVPHRLYLRMTLAERLQHASLMISFFLLVFTGFALRFPDTWWVQGIRSLSPRMFEVRSLVHRIAAVWMCGASLYHLYYVIATARGRQLIKDLFPRIQDAWDAVAVLKYNLGLSHVKPKFGRFSYIEKSEYWALVWGTIVMAATGFIMWFDNTFIGIVTKLGYDIARTVHYYEAWLATLAILVWHVYFVIFNPDAYPMNMAWITGHLSEREMEEEHALELEEIKKAEGKDAGGHKPKKH